jgi:23S rRNA-/tRNA-specific pseudouridylate synthase
MIRQRHLLPLLVRTVTTRLNSIMRTSQLSTTCAGLYLCQSALAFSSSSPVVFHHPPASSYYSTTTTTRLRSSKILQDEALTEAIQEAWSTRETDGILQLGSELDLEHYDLQDLVYSSLNAVPTKGQAAGVLNGWIGSCIGKTEDVELGAELAWELLGLYDALEDLQPDMVTLSLVYTAMTHPDLAPDYHKLGNAALARAQQLAKKQGGSKRRRSLVASARKRQSVSDNRSDLLELHDIAILHESEAELVVNKPSGMACFHKHKTTSGKVTASRRKQKRRGAAPLEDVKVLDISLETALLDASIPLSSLNVDSRGMVHRIDRGTSGCIVLAKTDERHAELVTQFFLRKVSKNYQALVELSEEETIPDTGTVDLPVHGRPALSLYQVEERQEDGKALLRIQTKTGRKHQIRVHCASGLHAPIVGDSKYGVAVETESKQQQISKKTDRFCLHAAALHIPGIPEIEAPIPTWWNEDKEDLIV